MKTPIAMAMMLGLTTFGFSQPAAGLRSSNASTPATAGYYTLSWSADEATGFELEEASEAGFADAFTRYRGADLATTVTGKRDGRYYYRVRAFDSAGEPGPWSETVTVEVAHHSLGRAWLFFATGALVFILSLVTILRGARALHGEEGRGAA